MVVPQTTINSEIVPSNRQRRLGKPRIRILARVPKLNRAAKALLVALSLLAAAPAFGQFASSQLKSFCSLEELGLEPYARLIQGSDGQIYGTTYLGGGTAQGVVFKLLRDGSGYIVLHVFAGLGGDGAYPYGGLIEGGDDALYGTTSGGGSTNRGTVFKLNKDGSGYATLHNFTGTGEDGASPYSNLIEGADDALYGTTQYGGTTNQGTVFKLNRDGSGYLVLHSFTGAGVDGAQPTAALEEGPGGLLYGTTYFGGSSNQGTVFKVNKDGSGYTVLHGFTGSGGDGAQPYSGLITTSDGGLYGTTTLGGSTNRGTVFKLNSDGSGYSVVYSFTGNGGDGAQPYGRLIEGTDGALYGATAFGGSTDSGTVFKLNKDGSAYTVLRSFTDTEGEPSTPYGGLLETSEGALWGTTAFGGSIDRGTIFRLNKDGSGYSVLRNFAGTVEEAASPYASLIEASDQALYGTTYNGGGRGQGAVFKLKKDGTGFSLLHSFNGTNGANPHGGLIEGSDAALYGTTVGGGSTNQGTVFKLNKDGSGYTVLRSFTGTGGSGSYPYSAVVEGSDGALYGTTSSGGNGNRGTLFKLNKNGSGYSVLRSFDGSGTTAASPYGGLIEGSDGALYGTTFSGGTSNQGTVFKLNKGGGGYSVLRRFTGTAGDGANPYAGLVEGSDGVLYGTTHSGGTSNQGTIFKLNKNGSGYSVLHRFGGGEEGSQPSAGAALVEGFDGALYGTTFLGGTANEGVVFKLKKDGSDYTVLRTFTSSAGGGANPYGGLFNGSEGALYGTTLNGALGCGTLFRLAPVASLSLTDNGDLRLTGPAGFRFTVQFVNEFGSLNAWQNLTNITLSTNSSQLRDPSFGAAQSRFYRAVLIR